MKKKIQKREYNIEPRILITEAIKIVEGMDRPF